MIPAPLPEGLSPGATVQLSVHPEKIALDELEDGMISLKGTIEQRIYQGITTQVTVSLAKARGWWRSSSRPTGPRPMRAGSPGRR